MGVDADMPTAFATRTHPMADDPEMVLVVVTLPMRWVTHLILDARTGQLWKADAGTFPDPG